MPSQELFHPSHAPSPEAAPNAVSATAAPQQRAADPTTIAWMPQQLLRIDQEWRQLQRGYAFHPSVRIVPMHGDPPDEFQVHYRVRTVAVGDTGSLEYRTTCSVHFRLPAAFPSQPPIVRPIEAIFHPNVTSDLMQILPGWDAESSLAGVVERIGLLLAYQTYDPWNVWNPVAFEWLNANTAYLPCDPNANFRTDAGGQPLSRVIQHAPQALQQLREQLQLFTHRLLDSKSAPPFNEIERIVPRFRANSAMFNGDDLPEGIRRQAGELSEWAAQLRRHAGMLESLSKWKKAVAGAVSLTRELRSLMDGLRKELPQLRDMATPPASLEAAMEFPRQTALALPHLPQNMPLQQSHERLRVILTSAHQQRASAAARLAAIANPLPPLPAMSGPLENLARNEIDSQKNVAASIIGELRAVIAATDPILLEGIQELIALERIILWRRMTDAATIGADAAERISALGSDGLQAYHAISEAGEYGPFQFEQRLDLGGASVAVRDVHRLEVWDLKIGLRVARAEAKEVAAAITDPDSGQSFSMTFRLAPRCGELADHLARAIHHTTQFLNELTRHAAAHPAAISDAGAGANSAAPVEVLSWCRQLAGLLTSPAGIAAITAAHQQRSTDWSRLFHDLQALVQFKQRLATYYLMTRCREDVPRFQHLLADARQTLDASNEQITGILARCGRDIETNSPIMPAKYADQYARLVASRDKAKADIMRYELVLQTFARHLSTRLQSADLRGSATPLKLQAVAALPASIMESVPAMSDAATRSLAAELEQLLSVELWPSGEAATEAATAPVPADAEEPPPLPDAVNSDEQAEITPWPAEEEAGEWPVNQEQEQAGVDWPGEEGESDG